MKVELKETEESIKINSAAIEENLPIVKEKTEVLRETHKKLDTEMSKHVLVEDETAGNVWYLIFF